MSSVYVSVIFVWECDFVFICQSQSKHNVVGENHASDIYLQHEFCLLL